MCGRFTLRQGAEDVARTFAVQTVLFEPEPRFNIAPTQTIGVVHEEGGPRTLDGFTWGLVPSWAKDPDIGSRMINARAETLAEKPAFRAPLARRRCIIPADGFYEWKKEGPDRGPFHFTAPDGGLMALAGLWDEWRRPDGTPLRTCTIITTAPNGVVGPVHGRMPAVLLPEAVRPWLDVRDVGAPDALDLLLPLPDTLLRAAPVSRHVNVPGNEGPECLAPRA